MKDPGGYIEPAIIEKAIQKSSHNPKEELLLDFLWKTGRRVSEVLSLRVKDVHYDLAKITFPILKKKKVRGSHPRELKDVPLTLLYKIKEYLNIRELNPSDPIHFFKGETYIFHMRVLMKNEEMGRSGAYKIVRKAFERIGVTKIGDTFPHPHHLRHSFAVHFAKKAKNPRDITVLQRYLNHATIGMTMNYLQFRETDIKETLDEMFDEKSKLVEVKKKELKKWEKEFIPTCDMDKDIKFI